MRKTWLVLACALACAQLATPALAQPEGGTVPQQQEQLQEQPQPEQPLTPPTPAREANCSDGQDEDGDGLADCADADCFEAQFCRAGGQEERTPARCGDWVDNDGDGAVDCEDDDCQSLSVCQGSWRGQGGGPAGQLAAGADDIPELTGDMSVEDLIGRAGDADGERTDEVCADGVDNDRDGRTDCQDFGCRFDPSVSVCAASPGIRFSLVAGIASSLVINETPDIDGDMLTEFNATGDVRFTRIQLRALGQIPLIQNSFFLINIRAERTVRLTFATFNIPLGNAGHYLSINSGSGGLSPGLIVSTAKQPLLDPPFYLFNAFEQSNGAAAEIGGPIDSDDILRFRVFGAGGSGEFNGNVGGRFFRAEDRNFSYAGGAQLQLNIVGHYNRLDTPFLYTPVPLTVAVLAGARFDQRPVERYLAWNAFAIFRYWHFLIRAESYTRYVLDFDGLQTAFNVQASILLVPRVLMLAADVGGFYAPLEYSNLPSGGFGSAFDRPLELFQWRVAFHWYYFRNIGILSLLYSETYNQENPDRPEDALAVRELRLEAQFRF
ncbi:MAG: hypothetical protein IT378_03225 [Sandaracinaceae bacterium]|nr:hypothetical protein [Sandaracinaceae bacterium]